MATMDMIYKRLRADERFRAAVEALGRRDWAELQRLHDTCDPVAVSIPSPAYLERLQAFELASLTHGIVARDALVRVFIQLTDAAEEESRSAEIAQAAGALQAVQVAWATFCSEIGIATDVVEYVRYGEMNAFLETLGCAEPADSGPHLQALRGIWRARLARSAGVA